MESSWQPILAGAAAQSAMEAVDSISEAIPEAVPAGSDVSLAGGRAGLAVLYAWMAQARRSPHGAALARECLDEAVDALSREAMDPSLFGGFTGVAWAVEVVGRLVDPDPEDRCEELDLALLEFLSRPQLWPVPHDLVVGVTGAGVYALERLPRPTAVKCLDQVVARLQESARYDEFGAYWWTTPAGMLSQEARQEYPSGRADLGVAHGMAGAIALLGTICAAGVSEAAARPLLDAAVSWLRSHPVPDAPEPTFPIWVAPGFEPARARCAWCYGDPGVAAALLTAAHGARRTDWERAAVALARGAARRPATETGVVDAGFCHGTAGLAHLCNRMYQATREPALRHASLHWLERTLDHYRVARRDLGRAWVVGTDDPFEGPWTGVDLVDGAAGVALVLLAAATPVEPSWDRMFLVSAARSRAEVAR